MAQLDEPNIMSFGSELPEEGTGKARRGMPAAFAESLSAETLPEKPGASRRHHHQPSKAYQEEMQRKMDILMSDPKLWHEFKHYLAESGSMSRLGTQQALREFLETNKEIAAMDANAQAVQQTKQGGGMRRKIKGAVRSLSRELKEEGEEATPRNQSSPPRTSSPSRPPSTTRSSTSSASKKAADIGMGLLRRASEAASSSLGGLDREVEVPVEDKTNARPLRNSWFHGSAPSLKSEIDTDEIEQEQRESLGDLGTEIARSSTLNARSPLVGAVNSWFHDSARNLKNEIDMDEIKEGEDSLVDLGTDFEVRANILDTIGGWLQGSKDNLNAEIDMNDISKEEEIKSEGIRAEIDVDETKNRAHILDTISSWLQGSKDNLNAEIDLDEILKEEEIESEGVRAEIDADETQKRE